MIPAKFKEKSSFIMRWLMNDFNLTAEDAAAILGNIGHESAGFTKLQEIKPTVEGSRGGYGWPQWTGPRRRAYESYCARNNFDPASDKANYGYMFVELKGAHANAITKLKAAKTLYDKVVAFELQYEGAGVKHYPSRLEYANTALSNFKSFNSLKPQPPEPQPTLEPVKPIDTVPTIKPQSAWSRFWQSLATRLSGQKK